MLNQKRTKVCCDTIVKHVINSPTITDMLKGVLGVALGITAFVTWAVVSRIQSGADIDASVYEFIISVFAGAISVSFLRFLAGLALGMSCFTIWIAITLKGIGFIGKIMLPVLFGWSLGLASLGFALGILIAHGVRGLADRLGEE